MSSKHTRCPVAAKAALTLTAVVVLPTPPFWFMMAIERMEEPRGNRDAGQRRALADQLAKAGLYARPPHWS